MSQYGAHAKDLMELALTRAAEEHRQASEDWKLLDAKAQGTTAIAGIVMAAATVYIKQAMQLTGSQQVFLGGALLFLVVSIVMAVVSMTLKRLPVVIEVADLLKGVAGTTLAGTDLEDRYIGLQMELLKRFASTNPVIQRLASEKGFWLGGAHVALCVSASALLLLLLATLRTHST